MIIGLKKRGLSLQKISKVIEYLREHGYQLHSAKLATNGKKVWTEIDDKTIEIIEASAGQVVWFDWHKIVKECLNLIENKGVNIDEVKRVAKKCPLEERFA